MEEGLREKVFAFLKREGGIDGKLIERMRAWCHTGFSTHDGVRLRARDADGRRQLARYMIRPPFALEKMAYVQNSGLLDFIVRLAALIPTPRINLTRFHGVFAPNSKRRSQLAPARRGKQIPDEIKIPAQRYAAMGWAQCLKRVFKIDIETCEQCGGAIFR